MDIFSKMKEGKSRRRKENERDKRGREGDSRKRDDIKIFIIYHPLLFP